MRDKVVVCSTSEDAVEAYLMLMKLKKIQGFTQISTIPPEAEHLASYSLKQVRQTESPFDVSKDTHYLCFHDAVSECRI